MPNLTPRLARYARRTGELSSFGVNTGTAEDGETETMDTGDHDDEEEEEEDFAPRALDPLGVRDDDVSATPVIL